MNKKEEKDIAFNLSILIESIIDENSAAEKVANMAIMLCIQILQDYPNIKEIVDSVLSEKEWDIMIGWYNFEKQYLR